MKILYNSAVLKHPGNTHECPGRLHDFRHYPQQEVDIHRAEKAINDLYQHFRLNLRRVANMCRSKSRVAEVDFDQGSYEAILTSVALAQIAAERGDFAITRPPGHHANLVVPHGFCVINTIAVVVNQILEEGKKVAVLDIDGHHGNGTQNIFAGNPQVLYGSLHEAEAFPHARRGKRPRRDSNALNRELPRHTGELRFLNELDEILGSFREFQPDLLAVSAGFDGHVLDPLLHLSLTEDAYREAGKMIAKLRVQTFAVLEGGYHPRLKNCIDAFVDGFNDQET